MEESEHQQESILKAWSISEHDLTAIVSANPSLRGMLFGYVAEFKLSELLNENPYVSQSFKGDDHDRTSKGDRTIIYKDVRFLIECKSLQTNTVHMEGERWVGKAQVDASDKRTVELRDGTELSTTCLLVGDFDVLAVNLFAFGESWRFLFAKNEDLPRSRYSRYSSEQREQLLSTLVTVTWPPESPFQTDLFELLDELVATRSL